MRPLALLAPPEGSYPSTYTGFNVENKEKMHMPECCITSMHIQKIAELDLQCVCKPWEREHWHPPGAPNTKPKLGTDEKMNIST
jgi:hypothetical protein